MTINIKKEHFLYSNTKIPTQLKIIINDTKEHSHYCITQLPATVKNNTK